LEGLHPLAYSCVFFFIFEVSLADTQQIKQPSKLLLQNADDRRLENLQFD
jgi:hypothetical protein